MNLLRTASIVAMAVTSLAFGSACSDDRSEADAAASTPVAAGRKPAASPEAAVAALLDAEVRGDHDESFHLLSSASLTTIPDAESWFRRRIQYPEITSYRMEGVEDDVVTVVAEHEPGLDAFVGLRAATDTQRWRTVKENGGWLVDAEPEITFDLPDDESASGVAEAWVISVQACEESNALALQVEPALVGLSSGLASVCGSSGPVEAGPVEKITAGPSSADLVAQYGDAAFAWARAVRVDAGDVRLAVLLAPIGDAWMVVGVVDA